VAGWLAVVAYPGFVAGFVAGFVVFGYSAVTLALSARRTPDMTMKRHVRLLGFAIAFNALALFSSFGGFILSIDLLSNLFLAFFSYLLYRAVKSLSTIGRIEKKVV
jgi:hypothetical protein